MKSKKTSKANLENKKLIFVQTGLVIALLLLIAAFQYSSPIRETKEFGDLIEEIPEEDVIAITREELKPPPPPPPPPKVIEVLNIVEDDMDLEEELDIMDSEADADIEIEINTFEEEEETDNEIFIIVETMPVFPGGDIALQKFIAKNVKYPTIAMETGISGTVYIQFVVEKNGSVGGVKVLRKVDDLLDKEAVRVVKSLPNFSPGKQRGKTVRVFYSVPIKFHLQ